MVKKPSVFEPLKFYCNLGLSECSRIENFAELDDVCLLGFIVGKENLGQKLKSSVVQQI